MMAIHLGWFQIKNFEIEPILKTLWNRIQDFERIYVISNMMTENAVETNNGRFFSSIRSDTDSY